MLLLQAAMHACCSHMGSPDCRSMAADRCWEQVSAMPGSCRPRQMHLKVFVTRCTSLSGTHSAQSAGAGACSGGDPHAEPWQHRQGVLQ